MKITLPYLFFGLSALIGNIAETKTATLTSTFSNDRVKVENNFATLLVEAPKPVKSAIEAANRIAGKPYKYSGGHGNFEDDGYDCSGSTSYVLHAAGLLEDALSSGDFLTYGEAGAGKWITVYARAGHVYLVIGGARFDTTDHENIGPGWREEERIEGFTPRHPTGL